MLLQYGGRGCEGVLRYPVLEGIPGKQAVNPKQVHRGFRLLPSLGRSLDCRLQVQTRL